MAAQKPKDHRATRRQNSCLSCSASKEVSPIHAVLLFVDSWDNKIGLQDFLVIGLQDLLVPGSVFSKDSKIAGHLVVCLSFCFQQKKGKLSHEIEDVAERNVLAANNRQHICSPSPFR